MRGGERERRGLADVLREIQPRDHAERAPRPGLRRLRGGPPFERESALLRAQELMQHGRGRGRLRRARGRLHARVAGPLDVHHRVRLILSPVIHQQDRQPLSGGELREARGQRAAPEVPGRKQLPGSARASLVPGAHDAQRAATAHRFHLDARRHSRDTRARAAHEHRLGGRLSTVEVDQLHPVRHAQGPRFPPDLDEAVADGGAHVPGPGGSAAGDRRGQAHHREAHLRDGSTRVGVAPNSSADPAHFPHLDLCSRSAR